MRHSTIGSMIGKRSMISWFRLFVFWVVFRFFFFNQNRGFKDFVKMIMIRIRGCGVGRK